MLGKSVRLWREIGVSRLFIRYQIPSDLLSFSDDLLLPGESATPEKQLQLVKGQVEALFLVDGSGVINPLKFQPGNAKSSTLLFLYF
jgi:hypothetical protein